MARSLEIDPTDPAPIWRQIEERIRRLIAAGHLAPGAGIPSVRELSRQLRINPATVAKAYQRLTEAGVLEVKRGDGTYVSAVPAIENEAEQQRALREAALRYATVALSVGASRSRAATELAAVWKELIAKSEGAE